ncbi:MAG: Uma2 family endonuclease [Spirochaetes bacterium]|nr:Uma2 family endonuclease [Spirochaetota bacterium]
MIELLEKPTTRARVRQLSVEGYHRLYEQGLIDEKNELIRGVIIQKMPKSPQHVFAIKYIIACLSNVFQDNFCIRKEDPLTLKDSEPEPDIAVVAGSDDDFAKSHPTTAWLVVEVSKTTYDLDYDKQFLYAEAEIPEYWLVNLDKRETEVYRDPKDGVYTQKKVYGKNEAIAIGRSTIALERLFI